MMKTKFLILTMIATFILASCGSQEKNKLSVNKTSVKQGESIIVTFKAQGGLDNHAWIGLIPSGTEHGSESVNDQYDVSYQYLNGKTSGKLTFTAPMTPGSFDFRLNESDSKTDAKELASVSFTVE
jgi:hypothetical protein